MKDILEYFVDNIGVCLVCMRKSFQISAASWLISAVTLPFGISLISGVATTAALALSALWIAHLFAYSYRNSFSPLGGNTASYDNNSFFQNLAFAAGETAVLKLSGPRDRFGRSLLGQSYLVELRNADGSRTAYRKTPADVNALVLQLQSRGYTGDLVDPAYWLSTNSCERSSARGCKDHTCDVSTQSCKGTGGMGACRCS